MLLKMGATLVWPDAFPLSSQNPGSFQLSQALSSSDALAEHPQHCHQVSTTVFWWATLWQVKPSILLCTGPNPRLFQALKGLDDHIWCPKAALRRAAVVVWGVPAHCCPVLVTETRLWRYSWPGRFWEIYRKWGCGVTVKDGVEQSCA